MIIQPVAAVGSWAMSPACASAASALPVASLLVACWRAAVWLNGASPLRDGERVPAAVQLAFGGEQRAGECVLECRFVRSAAGRRAREQVRGEHHRALRVPSGDVEQQAEYPLAVAVLLLKADRDVLRERLHTGPWGTRSEVEYSRRCADELCPVAKRRLGAAMGNGRRSGGGGQLGVQLGGGDVGVSEHRL